MLKALTTALHDFSYLFFPHNCLGCGTDVLGRDAILCLPCLSNLPVTGFIQQPGNPVEKIFYGRVNIQQAGAAFYFTKQSVMQNLVFALKYKGNREAGLYLGRLLGQQIVESGRFDTVDAIVPLPLNPKRERQRGYNQAAIIAEGMQTEWNRPVLTQAVARKQYTQTQTHKGRVERSESMQNVFEVRDAAALQDKHILLVDDVVTTGASLEHCALPMLQVPGVTVSIATVAYTIL